MLKTADVFKYAKCKNTKHMPEVEQKYQVLRII